MKSDDSITIQFWDCDTYSFGESCKGGGEDDWIGSLSTTIKEQQLKQKSKDQSVWSDYYLTYEQRVGLFFTWD